MESLNRLVSELARLPGIGPKSAMRLAHHLLRVPDEEAAALASAIQEIKSLLQHCSVCSAITEADPCDICSDPSRDRSRICVVEEPFNIMSIEKTGEYRGLYHALLGSLAPHRGIGPGQLKVDALMSRLDGIEEVILATNPNVEGEATALFLAHQIRPRGIRITRLAFGMPVGADIEYTDEVTLGRALSGRREMGASGSSHRR